MILALFVTVPLCRYFYQRQQQTIDYSCKDTFGIFAMANAGASYLIVMAQAALSYGEKGFALTLITTSIGGVIALAIKGFIDVDVADNKSRQMVNNNRIRFGR